MAISGDVHLGVYNEALRILGERRLAALTENREPRRVLDDAWDNGGAVRYALSKGDWNFGLRSVEIGYDPGIDPAFGFRRAFLKPVDIARLSALSADPGFQSPLTARQYADEGAYWLSDHGALFVRFVSSLDAYGFNSGLWPEVFKKYLGAYLAHECCERITNSKAKVARADDGMKSALAEARSNDAMAEGVKFRPAGTWVRSRAQNVDRDGRRR